MSKDFSGVQKPYTGQFTLSTRRNTSKYGIKWNQDFFHSILLWKKMEQIAKSAI